ncbi:MAG: hypothetical protein ACI9LO_001238 [Planctomycetota bacterium]|jgi:hypothetical protein
MEEMQLAIDAATTPTVQLWMNWMLIVFAISILFLWKSVPARYVLGTFILSGFTGLLLFKLTGEVHLLGISHLLLWMPLAIYLYFKVLKQELFKLRSIYGLWIVLLMTTIVISLLFDIRDIALVVMGAK